MSIIPGSTIGILGGGQLGRMLAIGKAGAINAGLLAAQILSLSDPGLAEKVADWRARQTDAVDEAPE